MHLRPRLLHSKRSRAGLMLTQPQDIRCKYETTYLTCMFYGGSPAWSKQWTSIANEKRTHRGLLTPRIVLPDVVLRSFL